MNFSIIVAISENYAIGKNNNLLCHISGDLKRFKQITTGHTIIMGKNTFLSLPNGALPNRRNIVISSKKNNDYNGVEVVNSIEKAIEIADKDKENFIIGGGTIYKQFMPYVNKIYLTKIHEIFDADVFFPEIDETWKIVSEEKHLEHNPAFSYLLLEKK